MVCSTLELVIASDEEVSRGGDNKNGRMENQVSGILSERFDNQA